MISKYTCFKILNYNFDGYEKIEKVSIIYNK